MLVDNLVFDVHVTMHCDKFLMYVYFPTRPLTQKLFTKFLAILRFT